MFRVLAEGLSFIEAGIVLLLFILLYDEKAYGRFKEKKRGYITLVFFYLPVLIYNVIGLVNFPVQNNIGLFTYGILGTIVPLYLVVLYCIVLFNEDVYKKIKPPKIKKIIYAVMICYCIQILLRLIIVFVSKETV